MLTHLVRYDMDEGVEEIKCARNLNYVVGIDEVDEETCLLRFDDDEEILAKGTYPYFFYLCNGFVQQYIQN